MENKHCFPKEYRLLNRQDYQEVGKSKTYFAGQSLLFQWRPNALSHSRLGITVSRKFGKAHNRNYLKRAIREIFRQLDDFRSLSIDINVKPRSGKSCLTFEQVFEEFRQFLISYRNKQK